MGAKLKISEDTIAKMVGDIHALTEVVSTQARTIQMLEARLAVCEAGREMLRKDPSDWWQKPVISFQGRDAGEQANVL